MSCAFCDRVAAFVPVERVQVCHACASMIGRLAEEPSSAPNAWNEDSVQPLSPARATAAPDDADVVFARFKEDVARQIPRHDSCSHLTLAQAYVQMGLLADARREAGVALAGAIADVTHDSLRILLTPPLLREDGIARLRSRLSRSASN